MKYFAASMRVYDFYARDQNGESTRKIKFFELLLEVASLRTCHTRPVVLHAARS